MTARGRRSPRHDRSRGTAMTSQGGVTEIRRTAALLRGAQAVRRRLEKLAALDDDAPPSSKRLLDEALVAVQRLADDLARHQRIEQRRLQNALRSGRR
jgi:hypothetical protein